MRLGNDWILFIISHLTDTFIKGDLNMRKESSFYSHFIQNPNTFGERVVIRFIVKSFSITVPFLKMCFFKTTIKSPTFHLNSGWNHFLSCK